jgi:hypothetical protein
VVRGEFVSPWADSLRVLSYHAKVSSILPSKLLRLAISSAVLSKLSKMYQYATMTSYATLADILQFVSGEDGMDGARMEEQQIDSYYMLDRAFYENIRIDIIGAEDENAGFHEGWFRCQYARASA